MKILNLYAGIGGNRKLWSDEHEVTAVENVQHIADTYKKLFPNDTVILADAHQYLLDHYKEFDLIWSSPPCPTHGQYRFNVGVRAKGYAPVFPDMRLYEEVIFLKHHFEGLWVVENVKPYYQPLIDPTVVLQRHYFWSNFDIEQSSFAPKNIRSKNKVSDFGDLGYDLTDSGIKNKRQALRNCVDPLVGLHILSAAKEATKS